MRADSRGKGDPASSGSAKGEQHVAAGIGVDLHLKAGTHPMGPFDEIVKVRVDAEKAVEKVSECVQCLALVTLRQVFEVVEALHTLLAKFFEKGADPLTVDLQALVESLGKAAVGRRETGLFHHFDPPVPDELIVLEEAEEPPLTGAQVRAFREELVIGLKG